ncbi:PAS domain-containing sensor histidine kinase [Nocardioides kribbensis]|uniref:histidine kinase n=1 Tax=Nocardioides kribbensis TaxID=305517 RepID=A0ABV1P380_9ACTN
MDSGGPALGRTHFDTARVVVAGLLVLTTLLLLPWLPMGVRGSVTTVALLAAGVLGSASAALRARRTTPRDRRPWLLLAIAGVAAISGNVWSAAMGSDPVSSPSVVGDGLFAVALLIATAGLLSFPTARRRGAELVVMFLDGLVAGGAMLLIVSVLVYPQLLDSSARDGSAAQALALLLPLLDVVLATVAVLLLLRVSRSQRLGLGLVAAGFLLYAVGDLTFAVRAAEGSFVFGTVLDLGWIAGYAFFGLAAWAPLPSEDEDTGRGLPESIGTMVVFAVLLVAAVVQVTLGESRNPNGAQAVAWLVLIVAAGVRQVLLTADNAALRRGLERRVAEQTEHLRQLARQNELLLDSVGDGIYGVDRDGRITFLNPSAGEALGYTLAELEGRPAHPVLHATTVEGRLVPWEECPVFVAMSTGQVQVADDELLRRADGSTFPADMTAAPLIDDDEVLGGVIVFRDVTQRREVDRIKDEFLSVVSHELRTPLTSIRASLEMVADGHLGPLSAGATRMVTVALESSERLSRLINDLLDLERLETGGATRSHTAQPAHDLLEAAARQIEGMAGSLGVGIEVGRADGVVHADADQVMQTLTNLIGNACKFSEPGSVVTLESGPATTATAPTGTTPTATDTAAASRAAETGAVAAGPQVLFEVRDHGRGIPADMLSSVFERFEQVDSSDTREKGGTGLGLTISRQIVTRHGGRIWIESEVGVGTSVFFTLPAA